MSPSIESGRTASSCLTHTFTVQLALTRFSTFYATDQGLTFAAMAIAILPPLILFLVFQRSFIQGLTAGAVRR